MEIELEETLETVVWLLLALLDGAVDWLLDCTTLDETVVLMLEVLAWLYIGHEVSVVEVLAWLLIGHDVSVVEETMLLDEEGALLEETGTLLEETAALLDATGALLEETSLLLLEETAALLDATGALLDEETIMDEETGAVFNETGALFDVETALLLEVLAWLLVTHEYWLIEEDLLLEELPVWMLLDGEVDCTLEEMIELGCVASVDWVVDETLVAELDGETIVDDDDILLDEDEIGYVELDGDV